MDVDYDSGSDTPSDISEKANAIVSNMLPAKSKLVYEKTYDQFREWCDKKHVKKVSENVLICYFEEKSKIIKPPTLWSVYSMLKSTLNVKENIDIRKFSKLVPLIKNKSVGYRGKKSKVLSRDDINKFIQDADNETNLLYKVVLILGISGACRREELLHITIDAIEDAGSILIVKIPDTKTYCARTFTVSNSDYIEIYRKYRALRPPHTKSNRLFLKYSRGKCINQHVGINKIGEIPSLIAKWLGKDMYKSYTGHCFRRSSVTLLANAGGNITSIKRHGGWKSASVAEAYIEDSLNNKIEISNKILNCPSSSKQIKISDKIVESTLQEISNVSDQQQHGTSSGIYVGSNCSNFTINYYSNK